MKIRFWVLGFRVFGFGTFVLGSRSEKPFFESRARITRPRTLPPLPSRGTQEPRVTGLAKEGRKVCFHHVETHSTKKKELKHVVEVDKHFCKKKGKISKMSGKNSKHIFDFKSEHKSQTLNIMENKHGETNPKNVERSFLSPPTSSSSHHHHRSQMGKTSY